MHVCRTRVPYASCEIGQLHAFGTISSISREKVKTGASANADYSDGVAIFTQAKGGLMYEASVGGQKFKTKPLETS